MIRLDASNLRALAEALDALAMIEATAGVRATGYNRGELTAPNGEVVNVVRLDAGDDAGSYAIEIDQQ